MLNHFHAPSSARPSGGKPGPWEPFQNTTHNGTYWAVHRWNDKWMGYVQVMNTKNSSPRRFGSQAAAQKAADAANAAEI